MSDQEREPTEEDGKVPAPRSQTTQAPVRFTEQQDAPRIGFERAVPFRGGQERR